MSAKSGLVLVVAVFALGGCSTVIVPPKTSQADALPVRVADYGYHSTLIIPRTEGGLIEYAFGDWSYFCQNQNTLLNGLHALLISEQATLGRRVIDVPTDQAGLEPVVGAKGVLQFDAPRAKVVELERALDARYSTRIDSLTYSAAHQLYFVKDDERYGVANNCNHLTARWLGQLGCRVEGVVLLSKFRLREPTDAERAPSTRPAAEIIRSARHSVRSGES